MIFKFSLNALKESRSVLLNNAFSALDTSTSEESLYEVSRILSLSRVIACKRRVLGITHHLLLKESNE